MKVAKFLFITISLIVLLASIADVSSRKRRKHHLKDLNRYYKEGNTTEQEQPKVEEPKTEEPKPEQPKAEEPKAEQPKTEEPKPEQPKTEEPKTEDPSKLQNHSQSPVTRAFPSNESDAKIAKHQAWADVAKHGISKAGKLLSYFGRSKGRRGKGGKKHGRSSKNRKNPNKFKKNKKSKTIRIK
jgi:outer membrane biosynthesis protein TonB